MTRGWRRRSTNRGRTPRRSDSCSKPKGGTATGSGLPCPVRDGPAGGAGEALCRWTRFGAGRGRLWVEILRNEVALGRTTIVPPDGPLRLEAGREGEALLFQVNAGKPLVCEDPFPIGVGMMRGFGVDWPPGQAPRPGAPAPPPAAAAEPAGAG